MDFTESMSDLEKIRAICSRFPEAEEGLLQDRPLFHVRRRRFAILNDASAPFRKRWDDIGASLHFMTDPAQRPGLERDSRFTLSPHHGFRGWMALDLASDQLDWSEVARLLESAYRTVAGKELVAEMDRSQQTQRLYVALSSAGSKDARNQRRSD